MKMNMLDNISLDELAKMCIDKKCEVTLNIEPTRCEINITPWKPFVYACPYKEQTSSENLEVIYENHT